MSLTTTRHAIPYVESADDLLDFPALDAARAVILDKQLCDVQTTVAALTTGGATAARGRQALLRVDGGAAAPFYDAIALVYDDTYGKWVSPVVESLFLGTRRAQSAAEGDLSVAGGSDNARGIFAFASKVGAYVAAGLTPQIRWIASAEDETGGHTITFKGYTASANDGAAGPATAAWTAQWTSGVVTLTTAGAHYATRSGWQAIATTDLTKDVLFVKATHTANSAVHFVDSIAHCQLRFVG